MMLPVRLIPRKFCRFLCCRSTSSITSLSVKDVVAIKPLKRTLSLQGWVQAVRRHKDNVFVDLIDGSGLDRLQVVIKPENNSIPPTYGSSVRVQGVLMKSEHKGQDVELLCDTWHVIGPCSEGYPYIPRQSHSPDYIRQFQHLRPKTRTFKSVLRIRNAASMAVHNFFQDRDFLFIHTPIITLNDCEGGGEVFYVEPWSNRVSSEHASQKSPNQRDVEEHNMKENANLSSSGSAGESCEKSKRDEFFKYPAFLTVSGQFHLEAMTGAFPGVYNFGPTFRAERNHTSCHLSEFSMIEAEVAFINSLNKLTELVEHLLKNLISHVMNTCPKEMDQICLMYSKKHKDFLSRILSAPFLYMSYSEVVEVLEKHRKSLKDPLKWGEDFGSEHKKFIIKYCNNVPVFVTEFPASIKPFYMKANEDGKGICFDLLAPFGNEICSGSLREDNYEILEKRLQDMGIVQLQENSDEVKKCLENCENTDSLNELEMTDPLSWYLEIRKYGSVPHGGFGVGFDRVLQTVLGIPNIRDVVPFPRWRNHCKC